MTLRQYLIMMTFGTVLAWAAVAAIVFTVNPLAAPTVVFGVFYASLFVALTGTLSIFGLLMRMGMLRKQLVVSRHVSIAFRQALLLSLLIVIALFLRSKTLLTWWNALLIVAALTVLEFFFISTKGKPGEHVNHG